MNLFTVGILRMLFEQGAIFLQKGQPQVSGRAFQDMSLFGDSVKVAACQVFFHFPDHVGDIFDKAFYQPV